MKTQAIFATLPLLALFGATAPRAAQAQITSSGGGYLFRAKYAKGQKMSYYLTTATTGAGMPQSAKIEMPVAMLVTGVSGKVGTIKTTVGPVNVNGKEQQKATTVEVKMDDRNRAVGGNAAVLKQFGGGELPEKPIKVGGTFSATQTSQTPMGNIKVTSTYKFLGVKTVGSRKVAQMNITSSSEGAMSMKSSGILLLDMTDGSLVNMKMNTDMTMMAPNGGKPMAMKTVVTMERK